MVRNIIILFIIIFLHHNVFSQENYLDEISLLDNIRKNDLLNLKNDTLNSFLLRSTSMYQAFVYGGSKKFIKSFVFIYNQNYNSQLPFSKLDGSMFPSKGIQNRYSIGLFLDYNFFEINIQPEYITSENQKIDKFEGNTSDGNWWTRYYYYIQNNIDDYKVFDYNKTKKYTFGQSRLGFKFKNVAFGISNENLYIGPTLRSALVMSNNAPGFKHIYIKNLKPFITPIGDFNINYVSGFLDTFLVKQPDEEIMNSIWPGAIEYKIQKKRILNNFTVTLNTKFDKNLFLGFTFSKISYNKDSNSFQLPYSKFSQDKPNYKIGSLFFRYKLPKSNAEIYSELAFNNSNFKPFELFADSSILAYSIGARKLFPLNSKRSFFELSFEYSQLSLMDPRRIFANGDPFGPPNVNSFYTSSKIRQGYTYEGQNIGSFIGPGSNSQYIYWGFNYLKNKIGIYVERIAYNNDFYHYANLTNLIGYSTADAYWVELNYGINFQIKILSKLLLSSSFNFTNSLNYRWYKNVIDFEKQSYAMPGVGSDKFNSQNIISIKYTLNENY